MNKSTLLSSILVGSTVSFMAIFLEGCGSATQNYLPSVKAPYDSFTPEYREDEKPQRSRGPMMCRRPAHLEEKGVRADGGWALSGSIEIPQEGQQKAKFRVHEPEYVHYY